MSEHPPVEETVGINGGYPVVWGTRTPVRTVVAFFKQSGDLEKVAELLPHLTHEEIEACLGYYRAHPERIDEDTESNDLAWNEARASRWPA
jgi:uncharacterized protein (DUF433 family)